MYLKVPDGDRKTRAYQVVSMKPVGTEGSSFENSAYRPEDRREEHKSADKLAARPIQKSDRSKPPQNYLGGITAPGGPFAPRIHRLRSSGSSMPSHFVAHPRFRGTVP